MILRALRHHYTKFVERARSGLPRVSIAPPAARLEDAHRAGVVRALEAAGTWPQELRDALIESLPRPTDHRTVDELSAAINARMKHAAAVHNIVAIAERGLDDATRTKVRQRAATVIAQRVPTSALRTMLLDELAARDEQIVVDTTIQAHTGRPPRIEDQAEAAAEIYAARAQQVVETGSAKRASGADK